MAGIARALAEGINGYIRGHQIRQGLDDREADRQFQQEQRDAWRAERDAKTNERRQMAAAAAPVTLEEGAGGALRPEAMDDRDVGQPGEAPVTGPAFRVAGQSFADKGAAEKALAEANAPDAVVGRQAQALRGLGKATEALQLESAHTQGKAAKLTLEKAQEDFLNEKWDQRVGAITAPGQLAEVLSGSPMVGGAQIKAVPTADGKQVQLVKVGADGQETTWGKAFSNDARGTSEAIMAATKGMSAAQKITAMQHFAQFDESRRQFDENLGQRKTEHAQTLAQRDRHHADDVRQRGEQIGISRSQLAIAQQKAAEDHALPPATKLHLQGLSKTIDGINAAINKAQADGMWDPTSQGATDLMGRLNKAQRDQAALLAPYVDKESGRTGVSPKAKPSYADFVKDEGNGAPSAPNTPPTGRAAAAVQAAAPAPAPVAAQPGRIQAQVPFGAAGDPARTAPPQAAQPAQPAQDPLLAALGASGNSSIDQIVARQAPALRQAADVVRAAQAQVVAAAQRQDQQGVAQATQAAAQAGAQLRAMLAQMEPGMAARVQQALGV